MRPYIMFYVNVNIAIFTAGFVIGGYLAWAAL